MTVLQHFDTMSYAPAIDGDGAVRMWLAAHPAFGHFINGAFTEVGMPFGTSEQATGAALAILTEGSPADVGAAVDAASAAQPKWAALPGHARARHLYALARMVQRHGGRFAVLESLDNGKPVREARDIDVPLAARHFAHHAGWAQLQDMLFPGLEPMGVVGQIIPWNFPLLMLAWKIAPALALGNTVVLKPAEYTSLTALFFAELAMEAGLPPGVFNVVTGGKQTGEALVAHPGVDKIAFTGSTEAGRDIRVATAGRGKSLALELSGKSPFIVFEDADLDAAIEGVVDTTWFNQGEVCCAGSRILVAESVARKFEVELLARMQTLRVGNPLDKTNDMGALIDPSHKQRLETMLADAVADGAQIVQPNPAPEGSFFPPTLVKGAHPTAAIATEEVIGTIAVIMTFRTPDEAVQLANHSRYGLAASIWSENVGQALEVAHRVSSGVVWVNSANLFDAAVGFGGKRESGFGREGGYEGCFNYLRPAGWWDRPMREPVTLPTAAASIAANHVIDRTAKFYIGGKKVEQEAGANRAVVSPVDERVGEVGEGGRKDIRNAVAAARQAESWATTTAHNRAQILFYIAENLAARAKEFAARIDQMTGTDGGRAEVASALERLFHYGAYADKLEGRVHRPPLRGIAMAIPEPQGVVGIVAPPLPSFLGFVALVAPVIAAGNTVVAVPSEPFPLAVTDFVQVLETSDVPPGVINIVTGTAATLGAHLAAHNDVSAIWAFGDKALSADVERLPASNLKRVFVDDGRELDLTAPGTDQLLLRHAVDIKNVWVPYGA